MVLTSLRMNSITLLGKHDQTISGFASIVTAAGSTVRDQAAFFETTSQTVSANP